MEMAFGRSLNVAGAIQVDSVNVIGALGDLRMNNLDAGDFDGAALGAMIVGKVDATNTCTTVCTNHGLTCTLAYNTAGTGVGCSSTASSLYCWCI